MKKVQPTLEQLDELINRAKWLKFIPDHDVSVHWAIRKELGDMIVLVDCYLPNDDDELSEALGKCVELMIELEDYHRNEWE